MADVAIARCEGYENAEAALTEALAPFGGLDWARPGMKVALKVNLVSGGKPDSAVVPHPKFVSALCRLLVARGAEVIVGDSPGGLYTAPFVGHVYSALRHDRRGGNRRAAEPRFFPARGLVPRRKDIACLSVHGVAGRRGCDHRRLQIKDPRHDGHVLRRQESLRRHPRHLETGISLPLPKPGRFCRDCSSTLPISSVPASRSATPSSPWRATAPRRARRARSARCWPRRARTPSISPPPTSSACERRTCPPSLPLTGAVISPRTRKPFPSPGELFAVPDFKLVAERSSLEFTPPHPPAPSERWRAGPCAA